jgi:hypothetical protein
MLYYITKCLLTYHQGAFVAQWLLLLTSGHKPNTTDQIVIPITHHKC